MSLSALDAPRTHVSRLSQKRDKKLSLENKEKRGHSNSDFQRESLFWVPCP